MLGNGVDNRSVTGVGFQPDYVIVLSEDAKEPVHRSSAQTGDTTLYFNDKGPEANHIQALQADGFQVGNNDRVNKSGVIYHYVAWKKVTGKMSVGSYRGNSGDNRNFGSLGFKPGYVIIKQNDNKEAVHRPATVSGDNTLKFIDQVQAVDMIQELRVDGFQVGTSDRVNKTGEDYFWVAFAGPNPSISSAANQAFYVSGAAAAISPITITDHALTPQITAANDIRVRIPAGFNMTWDTSVTTATISGDASSKVSTAVSYEDAGKTLVLNVTANFAAAEEITLSGLSFTNFTAFSLSDNLELEISTTIRWRPMMTRESRFFPPRGCAPVRTPVTARTTGASPVWGFSPMWSSSRRPTTSRRR